MREDQRKIQNNKNSREVWKRRLTLTHWKIITIYLIIFDVIAVNFSYFFALLLRFDLQYSNIPDNYLQAFIHFCPIYSVAVVVIFLALGLYNSIWRFASFSELNRILAATVATVAFHTVGITILLQRMPVSYYLFGATMQFILVTSVRFVYRYITLERTKLEREQNPHHNVMIIGAGSAGMVILREIKTTKAMAAKPCCFIDDNPNKWGRHMGGVPVAGGRDKILEAVRKYHIDQIMVAMPTASPKDKRDILNICKETQCELMSLPGVYQLANGEVSLSKMRPVAVEDLLGRDPIWVDMDEIFCYLKGKTILVTGGGGSIGSELCRQIAAHGPKRLIIFDIYENNAYDIEQELRRRYRDLDLVVLIGSVRDSRRINSVFAQYRPDIVYHAAAHKHVPLMETSPNEAIKNNVVGTYKTAYAAMKYGTKRFVLISTDKAVNPTNIMGASKRLCEMVIQSMDAVSREGKADILPILYAHQDETIGQAEQDPMDHTAVDSPDSGKVDAAYNIESIPEGGGTRFVAVRFGNVLGSNGSVIPLFKKQIEAGGPVTVTHPDIVRYFMTIPEAVSLVLQAGVYARGGEIFVLDMGEPVKIDDLARNLIRLSGYEPDVDIAITYTGLRSGEKLFEEKLMAEEGLMKTANDLIHIGQPIPFDTEQFLRDLKELVGASYENNAHIVEMVERIVPTFHPAGEHPGEANAVRGK